MKRNRDKFWQTIEKAQSRNVGVSEEELNADVEAAIAEVRAEKRARRSECEPSWIPTFS